MATSHNVTMTTNYLPVLYQAGMTAMFHDLSHWYKTVKFIVRIQKDAPTLLAGSANPAFSRGQKVFCVFYNCPIRRDVFFVPQIGLQGVSRQENWETVALAIRSARTLSCLYNIDLIFVVKAMV